MQNVETRYYFRGTIGEIFAEEKTDTSSPERFRKLLSAGFALVIKQNAAIHFTSPAGGLCLSSGCIRAAEKRAEHLTKAFDIEQSLPYVGEIARKIEQLKKAIGALQASLPWEVRDIYNL
jgi:hypothetical protein